jgi:hypothetical protein
VGKRRLKKDKTLTIRRRPNRYTPRQHDGHEAEGQQCEAQAAREVGLDLAGDVDGCRLRVLLLLHCQETADGLRADCYL